jgi:hypothetical protein
MLTFRDAKAMAKALESALRGKDVAISHGECLDIVARQFGLKDWNVLSAQVKRRDAADLRRAMVLKGWSFLAEHPTEYDHGADDNAHASRRRAALIRFDPATHSRYPDLSRAHGGYMQTVSAVPFHGKRLEVAAELCCEGVTHGATIWARVDGMPGHTLAFDNLKNGPGGWLFGDAPWSRRTIVIDVPSDAVSFHFGFFLKGAGSLWAADFVLKEIGGTGQLTTAPAGRQWEPTWIVPKNLSFLEVMATTDDGRVTGAT